MKTNIMEPYHCQHDLDFKNLQYNVLYEGTGACGKYACLRVEQGILILTGNYQGEFRNPNAMGIEKFRKLPINSTITLIQDS